MVIVHDPRWKTPGDQLVLASSRVGPQKNDTITTRHSSHTCRKRQKSLQHYGLTWPFIPKHLLKANDPSTWKLLNFNKGRYTLYRSVHTQSVRCRHHSQRNCHLLAFSLHSRPDSSPSCKRKKGRWHYWLDFLPNIIAAITKYIWIALGTDVPVDSCNFPNMEFASVQTLRPKCAGVHATSA